MMANKMITGSNILFMRKGFEVWDSLDFLKRDMIGIYKIILGMQKVSRKYFLSPYYFVKTSVRN